MSEEGKESKREYQRNRYRNMKKTRVLKKCNINFLYSIKMSKKTLNFDNVEVNKKEFHISKQPVALILVNVDQILISDKCEHSDKGFKYFIGYKDDNIVRPL